MKEMYFLQVATSGLGISVELNNIPVVTELTGEGISETQPVNTWLRRTANTLTVKLSHAVPEPEDEDDEDYEPFVLGEPAVEVILFINEPNAETIKVGKVLASFTWPILSTETEVELVIPYQHSETVEQVVPMPSSMVLWNKTSAIAVLSPQDKNYIYESVKHLGALISSKRSTEAFKFMGVKYQDLALADNKPVARLQEAAIEMWEHMANMPGVELQAIAADELNYDLVGHSHLVNVTRLDGAPPVLFEEPEDEMYFGVPLMFGKVEGKWVIVR
jgi:hypothetical protein